MKRKICTKNFENWVVCHGFVFFAEITVISNISSTKNHVVGNINFIIFILCKKINYNPSALLAGSSLFVFDGGFIKPLSSDKSSFPTRFSYSNLCFSISSRCFSISTMLVSRFLMTKN